MGSADFEVRNVSSDGPAVQSLGSEATVRGDHKVVSRLAENRTESVRTNPLVPLRRLSTSPTIDLAFDLLSHRFQTILGLAVTLFIPLGVIDVVISRVGRPGIDSGSMVPVLSALADGSASSSYTIVVLGLQFVAMSMLGIAVGHLVSSLIDDREPSFAELVLVMFKRAWVSVPIVVMTALIYAVSNCLPVIGAIGALALTFVASIAAGAEKTGPFRAMQRSITLSRARFGAAIAVSMGGLLLTLVVQGVVVAGPSALLGSLGFVSWVESIAPWLAALSSVLSKPLTACIAAAAYVMFRTRSEGLDLHKRLADFEAASVDHR